MPKSINYTPVFDLISAPRLSRFDLFINEDNDEHFVRYGTYLWSQNAAASIYPLIQHLEVLLRNAIDNEARKRFGEYWWETIATDKNHPNGANFQQGIERAKKSLTKAWRKKEKKKLGLAESAPLPDNHKPSKFPHDDIIAATDFGTWKDILVAAYSTSNSNQQASYLWPKSFSKVFRKFHIFNSSPVKAREDIIDAINEIRDYRNRLFHHDCIWVKSKSTNTQNAVDSIREKINLIEKLIICLSPPTANALQKWGTIEHSRHMCSINTLTIYTSGLVSRSCIAIQTLK